MDSIWVLRAISALGLAVLVALAWILSEKRQAVQWRIVLWGMGLQFILALLILRTPVGAPFFQWVKAGFDVITAGSDAGASFVFGNLSQFFLIDTVYQPGEDGLQELTYFPIAALIAFRVLPIIIFVSALSAVLQHYGIVQAVVKAMAWLMRRSMKTSGAETFGAALLVFLGIESVSALGGYLKSMTRSEIFTLMVGFLATISASVMLAYQSFGAEAGHLLTASIMSAPAALIMAKLLIPETSTPETSGSVRIILQVESHNFFDAAARGASTGLQMALNVAALLIVFVGFIHLADLFCLHVLGHSLVAILGWAFRPFAFLMGIPWADLPETAELLATKTIFNEFLAYQDLQPLIESQTISPRAVTITTYALCGFANPGSLGILIGALSALAPGRRDEVAQMCLRALAGGTFAAFSTACIAGILT